MKESPFQSTAILIFANSPEEEMRHKSLVAAEKFYADLTGHALEIVEKTGLPFYLYSEKEQHGVRFGDRFYNAICEIYQRGYEYVITLGNDTPQLSTAQLLKTVEKLQAGRVVLGPSLDGGFYLMGIHRSQFSAINFRDLPWQSSKLREAYVSEIHKSGFDLEFLDVLSDIDDLQDLIYLVNSGVRLPEHVWDYYCSIFDKEYTITGSVPDFTYTYSLPNYYNKGSPVSAAVQLI